MKSAVFQLPHLVMAQCLSATEDDVGARVITGPRFLDSIYEYGIVYLK